MSALDARYADEAFDKLHAERHRLKGSTLRAPGASAKRLPPAIARASRARDDVRPDLVPFLKLPPPERPAVTRARMAQVILDRVSATGQITAGELNAAGFTDAEIVAHFHGARRIARVERMVV